MSIFAVFYYFTLFSIFLHSSTENAKGALSCEVFCKTEKVLTFVKVLYLCTVTSKSLSLTKIVEFEMYLKSATI